jgi:fumarate hydratase class II
MADEPKTRIEHDSMGEVEVPEWARWAAQTQRATENFPISGIRIDHRLVAALAAIKGAAAVVNARLGVIEGDVADAIVAAAAEVAANKWDEHFPIDVFQTGSGTSSNMNANEVIANLATERLGRRVHPNDHVNASQSSNDVFPTAIHLAAAIAIERELVPALQHLVSALRHKAAETATVVKAGRTHLMDATPVTLGQELSGYATSAEHGWERARSSLPHLCELALGGTAVGTGINAPPLFARYVIERLASATGLPLREADDHFEAQGGRDAVVQASGTLRTIALSLARIANDLRLMGSGPRAGVYEIRLPDLQPGSSIMPGKVNPVIPEAVYQVAAQVVGNDAAIGFGATAGAFELNTAMPMMARNILESVHLLTTVSRLLADRCVAGIEPNVERCRTFAESSSALATALTPHIGYEEAAAVVHQAAEEEKTLREVVLERGLLRPGEVDRILDVEAMTRGGVL